MSVTELVPERAKQSPRKHRRVVLACNDFRNQHVLMSMLRQNGLEPIPSSYLNETKFLLAQADPALVICQSRFSDGDFRDLLRFAAQIGSKVPVIVCADFYDPDVYLEAMELGAFDYFAYPYHPEAVEWVVGNALKDTLKDGRITFGPQRVHA